MQARKDVFMEFLQSIDWMQMLKCFVVGGLIIFGLQKMKDVTEKAE